MFDIYGGLIFVGTIVSLVLMIGTFTMMYYKILLRDMKIGKTIELCVR